MEFLGLVLLALLGIVLVLPIVAWAIAMSTRSRLAQLKRLVEDQGTELTRVSGMLQQLRRDLDGGSSAAGFATAAAPLPSPAPRAAEHVPEEGAVAEEGFRPEPEADERIEEETSSVFTLSGSRASRVSPGSEPDAGQDEVAAEPRVEPIAACSAAARATSVAASIDETTGAAATPVADFIPASSGTTPPDPPQGGFDWERLVGVKLFSAIAGIALVIAAVFFLRFSVEQGWLQPPVRVAIGILVALGLLVGCELRAARRYPATANALDAAAIAILFATFFAAHALWNLIPALVTFALLALVTAVAVLLSIRRESLFIAVLGLVGGFATPALLSTGEDRPIPLFAYLLLLNVGLAWVAYRKRWPSLTWLSLGLTTIYQWGWAFRFLDASSVSLGMGVFLIFPVAAVSGLMVARRPGKEERDRPDTFEGAALLSAALPAIFAVYLAAVPEYGARPGLLFGFVLLLDAGLLAIALARREEMMHALGAMVTVLTMAIWLALSYPASGSSGVAVAFTAVFCVFYLFAPAVAQRLGRPLEDAAASSALAAPLLLFVFAVLARIDPASSAPLPLFVPLLGLIVLIAWRAVVAGPGALYHVAAFFAVAAQAMWSATHLTVDRLGAAVMVYAVFGLVVLAVPLAARRVSKPLVPVWGSGAVLLASLALLFFLSLGPIAPAALWALALLLAILNAGLFVESAAGGLPRIAQAGSLLSWVILLAWWGRAAASVGVLPSLTVLTGLTLVTLAGHAWSARSSSSGGPGTAPPTFAQGLYLALVGHFFLLTLATSPAWAIPPLPLFGSLAVMTLATTAASLYVRVATLHAAGTIAAAVVILGWAHAAGAPPYGLVALLAAATVSAYALLWLWTGWTGTVKRDSHSGQSNGTVNGDTQPGQSGLTVPVDCPEWASPRGGAAAAAVAVLCVAEVTALVATAGAGRPPFAAILIAHAVNIALILALGWSFGWRYLAVAAVVPAWLAVLQWQILPHTAGGSVELLLLAGVLYGLFVAYPLILGRRAAADREPYLAAVLASAMFFFAGRAALISAGLDWMMGIVPVGIGAILVLLLRQLLGIQPPESRDIGRLALVAGAALAFVTVAIPLQLTRQWITIGWALEGAALAWLYRRIPHRGLLYSAVALLTIVFVRLALNPEVFLYEPRGSLRILNWYLYAYLVCAVAFLMAGRWLSRTDDRLPGNLRPSRLLPAGAVILLFLLLNIEIADFYATGPGVAFRFGVTVSQDLTYTIAWLVFGMALLAAGIWLGIRQARIAAVVLIAVTTFKCFLYDLGSLEGLYRVGSFVGLAMSLALVSLALQKYILSKPREIV